jgi:hypothetical protein
MDSISVSIASWNPSNSVVAFFSWVPGGLPFRTRHGTTALAGIDRLKPKFACGGKNTPFQSKSANSVGLISFAFSSAESANAKMPRSELNLSVPPGALGVLGQPGLHSLISPSFIFVMANTCAGIGADMTCSSSPIRSRTALSASSLSAMAAIKKRCPTPDVVRTMCPVMQTTVNQPGPECINWRCQPKVSRPLTGVG